MNPPGGMFSGKPFLRYVSKLYEFVEEPFDLGKNAFASLSTNELMRRYMNEINTTYVVMHLLETIGVKADILSGASMGEIVFNLSNCATRCTAGADTEDLIRVMKPLEKTIRSILECRKEYEIAYFGQQIDLAKFYLRCDADKAKKALEAYNDVFLIIEGSPVDVLVIGRRESCLKLIGELGCIPVEMGDPIYVHTPVLAGEYDNIVRDTVNAQMYVEVGDNPYMLFSTEMMCAMDDTCDMYARNLADILTKPVNYRAAVKALYDQEARVFIDLSTTQLCGSWAKNTLAQCHDAEVISIY